MLLHLANTLEKEQELNYNLLDFASNLYLSVEEGIALVTTLNLASVGGTILLGHLTDRFHISLPILVSALGSATAILTLWGLTGPKPILFSFTMAYGLLAGGYTATWPGCTKEVRNSYADSDTTLFVGMLAAGRGLGSVVSGPISEKLLSVKGLDAGAGLAYGSRFGSLIVFTGVTGITAAAGGLGWTSLLYKRQTVTSESPRERKQLCSTTLTENSK